ncbi:hypothetical protein [Mesorhizobium sp. M7A.F.Ca.MR.362.00.0.0]|uniref:hypothetical protein n=1 Tax=Mesorhizobium sp. M7A.F.Ca.MR.362.00.0.0 TaxID=2496779 RepID=UPI000FD5E901|nr:hypothetical protein [Mesorhizobium sp. M7A.F.Ca.MR.362.00.0.0]RUU80483.1 hypothetical protein EOC06_12070 [Mesorhizobium sp. M7A.F.Ca.MR.362.00.0.0]
MNAAAAISRQPLADSHSINHTFEELEIEQDGLFFGSFWGTAELALNDPANGDFFVRHIVLRGDRFVSMPSALRPGRKARVPGFMALTRPAKDDSTFQAHLFRAIELAIYADETAQAAWANEMEAA